MAEVNELVQQFTQELLERMGTSFEAVDVEAGDGFLKTGITSNEDSGVLIGFHGENLDALQQILSLLIYKSVGEWQRVVVDVGGYREEHRQKLEELAENVAKKVRFLQDPVTLPAMTPYERRLIHEKIAGIPGVFSESMGEGRERRVVIRPGEKEETPPTSLGGVEASNGAGAA